MLMRFMLDGRSLFFVIQSRWSKLQGAPDKRSCPMYSDLKGPESFYFVGEGPTIGSFSHKDPVNLSCDNSH